MPHQGRQAGDTRQEIEATPEMIEAGATAVREIIGEDALFRGEAAKVAKSVFRAMQNAAKDGRLIQLYPH